MAEEKRWPFVLFIVLLVALHFLLRVGMGLGASSPDLLTVALLLSARRTSASSAAGLGLVLGLLRDSVDLLHFGADAVVMTVLGFLGARSRDYFVGNSAFFLAVYLFLGKIVRDVAFFLMTGGLSTGEPIGTLLLVAAIAGAYAAFAGVVALSAYRAVARER